MTGSQATMALRLIWAAIQDAACWRTVAALWAAGRAPGGRGGCGPPATASPVQTSATHSESRAATRPARPESRHRVPKSARRHRALSPAGRLWDGWFCGGWFCGGWFWAGWFWRGWLWAGWFWAVWFSGG